MSCVNIDANKNVTVKWSATRNGTARDRSRCRPTLKVANTQLIYAEVSYAYTPTVGYTITGTLTLSDRCTWRRASPRRSTTRTACT